MYIKKIALSALIVSMISACSGFRAKDVFNSTREVASLGANKLKILHVENKDIKPETVDLNIMIYFGANNNLSDNALYNIADIAKLGAPKGVAVTYFLQTGKCKNPEDSGDGKVTDAEAKEYKECLDGKKEIVKNHLDGIIPNDNGSVFGVIERGVTRVIDFPRVNTANPQYIVDFAKWAAKVRPAKRNMIILWDHGAGWITYSDTVKSNGDLRKKKSIVQDQDYSNEISIFQLKKIFENLEKNNIRFETIGFDACLMANAEVAFELAQYTKYVIASEETIAATGWPYSQIMSSLSRSSIDAETVGKTIVDEYIKYYDYVNKSAETPDDKINATLSFINTQKLVDFTNNRLVNGFWNYARSINNLKAKGETPEVNAIWNAIYDHTEQYEFNFYKDLGMLLDSIGSQNLARELQNGPVVHYASNMDHSSGLSIYMPRTLVDQTYYGLQFPHVSSWANVIKAVGIKNVTKGMTPSTDKGNNKRYKRRIYYGTYILK